MLKVLIIITTGMSYYSGLTTVMLNYYRAMNKQNILIDFASTNLIDSELKSELQEGNSNYYYLGNRKKQIINYIRNLKQILSKNKYDIIHVNGNSSTMVFELQLAKKIGVKKRIAHGHTTRSNYPFIHKILNRTFQKSYTHAIAVSKQVGEWLYDNPYVVLKNAINTEHYKYNSDDRKEYRSRYKLNGKYVIGNVGKLNPPKNQSFLLKIFKEIKKYKSNAILLLVGGGELEDKLKYEAEQLGIKEDVIFLGMIDDTSKIFQIMDVFVFTSIFEGLGVALIEAQASGLPCISSDVVPKETYVSKLVEYISLNLSVNEWAEHILNIKPIDRADASNSAQKSIAECGYDVNMVADDLVKIYNGDLN